MPDNTDGSVARKPSADGGVPAKTARRALPPIRTLTVGPGIPPGQPAAGCGRVADYNRRFGIAPTPECAAAGTRSVCHARRRAMRVSACGLAHRTAGARRAATPVGRRRPGVLSPRRALRDPLLLRPRHRGPREDGRPTTSGGSSGTSPAGGPARTASPPALPPASPVTKSPICITRSPTSTASTTRREAVHRGLPTEALDIDVSFDQFTPRSPPTLPRYCPAVTGQPPVAAGLGHARRTPARRRAAPRTGCGKRGVRGLPARRFSRTA